MAHEPKYYMVTWYDYFELHFFHCIILHIVKMKLHMVYDLNTWDLTSRRYKDTLYFEILWGVNALGSNISKTIHPIAMKFTEVN